MEGDAHGKCYAICENISIHSLRMEGDQIKTYPVTEGEISIHSLRMEGDHEKRWFHVGKGISIHSLRMEGDRETLHVINDYILFQSTPSAWRETSMPLIMSLLHQISIHSLRMEGDNQKYVGGRS